MYAVAQVGHIVIVTVVDVYGSVLATIVAVTAIGAVEPHFKLVVAILGKFFTLFEKDVDHIVVFTIVGGVAVPR